MNEKPKSITQLSKEQLEDMCLNLMHVDNEKANIIESLERQNEYLRSGEYLNQLKFERNMLEHIVENNEVSKEDKEFIDMTHRNTELLEENQSLKDRIEKANDLIDTILTFNLFGEECPLNFGFEKDSLQEKAQNIFYEDDGEYCENNCDDCHKKCWLKFFERIQILKETKNE